MLMLMASLDLEINVFEKNAYGPQNVVFLIFKKLLIFFSNEILGHDAHGEALRLNSRSHRWW